jgi:hypothetical protein
MPPWAGPGQRASTRWSSVPGRKSPLPPGHAWRNVIVAVDLEVGSGPEASTTGPHATASFGQEVALQTLRTTEQHRTLRSGSGGSRVE